MIDKTYTLNKNDYIFKQNGWMYRVQGKWITRTVPEISIHALVWSGCHWTDIFNLTGAEEQLGVLEDKAVKLCQSLFSGPEGVIHKKGTGDIKFIRKGSALMKVEFYGTIEGDRAETDCQIEMHVLTAQGFSNIGTKHIQYPSGRMTKDEIDDLINDTVDSMCEFLQ